MTSREQREGGQSPPQRPAEGAPSSYPGSDYSFTLQAVFEMKGTLGELTQAIRSLTEQVKDNDTKLDKISHRVYAAAAVVTVLTAISAFVLSRIWEFVVAGGKLPAH